MWFLFLPFILSFGRATGFVPSSILNLHVLLSLREDVPHPGNFMLHQIFVERVGNLQPIDERSENHIVIAVIHQGHLTLKITDVMFEALSGLHLDRDKVIIVILKLLSGSVLVIGGMLHLYKTLE